MVGSRVLVRAGLAVVAALSVSGAARAASPTYIYTLSGGSYDFLRPPETVDPGISGTITVANDLVTGLDLSVDLPSSTVVTFLTSGILDQGAVSGDWEVRVSSDSPIGFNLILDLQTASTLFGGGATLGPDTQLFVRDGDLPPRQIGNNFTGTFAAPSPVPGSGLAGLAALALAGLYVRARRA